MLTTALAPAWAKVYVQYDPATADASRQVYFSTVTIFDRTDGKPDSPAPQPPAPIVQLVYPDGTATDGMKLDLSKATPALVPEVGATAPAGVDGN